MPKLALKKKAEVLAEFPLHGAKTTYTVGSEKGNDIIVADKSASVTHFQLERRGKQYFVRDLKSAFGTIVNGTKIDEVVEIKDGDTIAIGEHTLVFRNSPLPDGADGASTSARSHPVVDFLNSVKEAIHEMVHGETGTGGRRKDTPRAGSEETGSNEPTDEERLKRLQQQSKSDGESLTDELSEVLEKASAATEDLQPLDGAHEVEKSPYYLLAIHGPYLGKKYQLNFGETKIGRDTRLNDIVIRENRRGEIDPSISRRHATITYRDNRFYLSDKRSKSRTYLNQDMLSETDELMLAPTDEIEIVSDQQSTILRFAAEGNWDFSFPKRAGAWWLRYRSPALHLSTAAISLVALILALISWYDWSIVTDVPDPLQAVNKPFAKLDGAGEEKVGARLPESNGQPGPLPLLANVNGDGSVDVIVTQRNGTLVALDGETRRRLWRMPAIILNQSYPAAAADLNKDGNADIVALTADGHLMAIDGRYGAEIWTSPFFAREIAGPAVIGDFDGDGNRDVAIMSVDGNLEVGYMRILDSEWVEVDMGVASRTAPSSVDLDRDGDDEILIATERGLVLIYDGVERRLAGTVDVNLSLNKLKGSFSEDNQIRHPVSAGDLSGDGLPDLVVSSRQGNLVCIDVAARTPDGKLKPRELWWSNLAQNDSTLDFAFPFALGDIDGDETPDVVAVADDWSIQAFRGLGREGQRQPALWRAEGGPIVHHPVLFDFDHDKMADIITVEKSGALRIRNGKSGSVMWQDDQTINDPSEVPLLADLGDDTEIDIVVLESNGLVQTFQTNRRMPAGTIVWVQRYGSSSNLTSLNTPGIHSWKYGAVMGISLTTLIVANLLNCFVRLRRRRFARR